MLEGKPHSPLLALASLGVVLAGGTILRASHLYASGEVARSEYAFTLGVLVAALLLIAAVLAFTGYAALTGRGNYSRVLAAASIAQTVFILGAFSATRDPVLLIGLVASMAHNAAAVGWLRRSCA